MTATIAHDGRRSGIMPVSPVEEDELAGNRRIDRIKSEGYVTELDGLDIDELRKRRDECRDELDHLSMLRRYLQSRAGVLTAEAGRRGGGDATPLVDQLAEILAGENTAGPRRSLGTAVRLREPDEEMLLARRRVEKLVVNAGVVDPSTLSEDELTSAVKELREEETVISADRTVVMGVLTVLQDELKRRFKEDPSAAIKE